jgi:hypothetical protein
VEVARGPERSWVKQAWEEALIEARTWTNNGPPHRQADMSSLKLEELLCPSGHNKCSFASECEESNLATKENAPVLFWDKVLLRTAPVF